MAETQSGSAGATTANATGNCDDDTFDVEPETVARVADRIGIGSQATPTDALRAVLTRGSFPYFGGDGGSGLVGRNYPPTGWKAVRSSGNEAKFEANVGSGSAKLTFHRLDARWYVVHGETKC